MNPEGKNRVRAIGQLRGVKKRIYQIDRKFHTILEKAALALETPLSIFRIKTLNF
jgi:hypothetical protein